MVPKLRIKIKGIDAKVVDSAVQQIVSAILKSGAKLSGPVPLPTKTRRWVVLRSPHVDARSKEAFEMKIHKRLIDILEPTSKTIDALTKLQLPAGVELEIKQQ
uniref:Small ribosomal subunit protein uS10 n=1 Tax=candidate division CPR3 bacterium TaxID=2268181 RepID=A0A7C5YX88_UNCC3